MMWMSTDSNQLGSRNIRYPVISSIVYTTSDSNIHSAIIHDIPLMDLHNLFILFYSSFNDLSNVNKIIAIVYTCPILTAYNPHHCDQPQPSALHREEWMQIADVFGSMRSGIELGTFLPTGGHFNPLKMRTVDLFINFNRLLYPTQVFS